MKILNETSHLDHGLTPNLLNYLRQKYADRDSFFIDTFELPEGMSEVDCGLHGPIMDEEPVPDSECTMMVRGNRAGPSRLCSRKPRKTRTLTVIAGPHSDDLCVLYTAFGGPLAPREPWDLKGAPDHMVDESIAFWSEHALSMTEEEGMKVEHDRKSNYDLFLEHGGIPSDRVCPVCQQVSDSCRCAPDHAEFGNWPEDAPEPKGRFPIVYESEGVVVKARPDGKTTCEFIMDDRIVSVAYGVEHDGWTGTSLMVFANNEERETIFELEQASSHDIRDAMTRRLVELSTIRT